MPAEETPELNLGTRLAQFAQSVARHHTAEQILQRLGEHCVDLLDADAVGVLVRNADGGLEVGTSTSPKGREIEQLEASLGEGPCAESVRENCQVQSTDLAGDIERWPAFVPKALELGVGSVHALPMSVRGSSFAVVDVMFFRPTEVRGWALTAGQLLADVAASYLANAEALRESTRLNEQLQRALDSRVLIEQAKGVLSERRGIGLEQAFELMRGYSRGHNRKLRDVATDVIRGDIGL